MELVGLNLTPNEEEALKQFKEKVKDILKPGQDEYYLIRWLRARYFDVNKAEDMLRQSMAWRKLNNVDTILTDWERPEVLQKYWPGGFHGFDKEGRPIWIARAGDHLDIKGLIMSASKKDILKNTIYHIEGFNVMCEEQSKKEEIVNVFNKLISRKREFKLQLGRRVNTAIVIQDMNTLATRHIMLPGQDVLLKIFNLSEENYPESLEQCYLINSPSIFPLIYKIIKPFLHEETAKKLVVLGSDWKEKLLEVIDADQLPVHWGGTATDPDGDPECRSTVIYGGTIPESYYLKGSQLVDKDKTTTVTVSSGTCLELDYTVPKEGHLLRWVYWTESYDIQFGVSYKDGSVLTEVEPAVRVDCFLVPEHGFVACKKAGTYLVKFDNSYSWVNSKQLSYSIEVVDPEALNEVTDEPAAAAAAVAVTEATAETVV